MAGRRLLTLAAGILALCQAASAGPPSDPGRPDFPVTPRPSMTPVPVPGPSGAGNWTARPPGLLPIEPGNAGARPALPPRPVAQPPAAPPPPNPARELLDAKRDLERCATGEIARDRHGRPCP